MQERHAKVSDR